MAKEELKIVITADDQASRVLGGLGGAMKGVATTIVGGAALAGGALINLGAGLGRLAIEAAPLPGIADGFSATAERLGQTTDGMLESLRAASAGTISDFELMRQANVALTGAGEEFGQLFGEALPTLLEAARASSRATGEDVNFLFESLVTGIKRSSPMILDNLGIQVNLTAAQDAYAASLGITSEELTAEQKQIALLIATQDALQTTVESANLSELSQQERISQLQAGFKNLKDEMALALLPVLEDVLDAARALFAEAMPEAKVIFMDFAEDLKSTVGPAMVLINDAITRISQALGGTSEEVSGLDVLLWAFKGTLDALVSGIQLTAITMQLLASGVESVSRFLRDGIDGWKRFGASVAAAADLIPEWLRPGSPTPFELGIKGIAAAMEDLNRVPAFAPGLAHPGGFAGASGHANGAGVAPASLTIGSVHLNNGMDMAQFQALLRDSLG